MILYNFKQNVKLRYMYSANELNTTKNVLKNHISFMYINSKKTNIKDGSRLSNKLGAVGKKIEPFLEFCTKMGVDYWNFLDNKNGNYDLYDGIISLQHNVLDFDKFGLSAKYIIENISKEYSKVLKDKEAIASNPNFVDIASISHDLYNGIIDGNTISYTALVRSWSNSSPYDRVEEKIINIIQRHHSIKMIDTYEVVANDMLKVMVEDATTINFNDRKLNAQVVDLFNTGIFGKYDVVLKMIDNEIKLNGRDARIVANDLIYFVKNNKIPCIRCNKLVDNAFLDYGIQFDKHGGCN